jgi:hypothetical protein
MKKDVPKLPKSSMLQPPASGSVKKVAKKAAKSAPKKGKMMY